MDAHFYDAVPEDLRNQSMPEVIARYERGGTEPGRAIEALSDAQLDAHPVSGTWSIREIVSHLMDTDLIATYRMKRVIAEDRPHWDLYDENAFVARLDYGRRDAQAASEVFRLNRSMMANLLRGVPESTFVRVARHAEVGEMPLDKFVRLYTHHLEHHMRYAWQKREMVLQE